MAQSELTFQSRLYVKEGGAVVTERHRNSVMMLIKILFRLDVITEEQATNIATKFHILFV